MNTDAPVGGNNKGRLLERRHEWVLEARQNSVMPRGRQPIPGEDKNVYRTGVLIWLMRLPVGVLLAPDLAFKVCDGLCLDAGRSRRSLSPVPFLCQRGHSQLVLLCLQL